IMIAILKYNAGNVTSLLNSLYRLGYTNNEILVTDDPDIIRAADKVLFPGVGAAGSALLYSRAKELDKVILSLQQPFLGICLGMQIMCDYCEEDKVQGLNIFPCKVDRLQGPVKVPHMGWNTITGTKGELFKNI